VLVRALVTVVALSAPGRAHGTGYVVHRGDTLSAIAWRSHLSVYALARINGIADPNRVRAGQRLLLPLVRWRYGYRSARRSAYVRSYWNVRSFRRTAVTRPVGTYTSPRGAYRVRWGDTLFGLALRYHTSVAALRASNPSLGVYLIAGQTLNLCTSCTSEHSAGTRPFVRYTQVLRPSLAPTAAPYRAAPLRIASRFGNYPASRSPFRPIATVQQRVTWRPAVNTAGYRARTLIAAYARQYGLESSLPLAIGAQESGFQQGAVSRAGAVGVMQVEPQTAWQISTLLGRPVNLYSMDDNIHAGVLWLAHLVAQYGGNERLAAAAYYQGSASLASRGFYKDTVRYVSNAMLLKTRYGP